MISYRDIARESGVSEMTVSRVLRGSDHVREGTRAKVMEAVRRLGYKPNPLVSVLMTQIRAKRLQVGANRLGWIYFEPDNEKELIFQHYLQGAKERARELGFEIDLFRVEGGITPTRLREILRTRGIHGLLINPTRTPHLDLGFDFEGFAAVVFGYSMNAPNLDCVTSHHAANQSILLEKLREKGYRDILYIVQPWMEERINFGWLAATMAFAQRYESEIRVRIMQREKAFQVLRKQDPQEFPDVVVFNRESAQSVLGPLGLRAPDDIGFASQSIELAEDKMLELSGMDQRSRKIGACAVDQLLKQLASNEFGPKENPAYLLVKGSWNEGETVRSTSKP